MCWVKGGFTIELIKLKLQGFLIIRAPFKYLLCAHFLGKYKAFKLYSLQHAQKPALSPVWEFLMSLDLALLSLRGGAKQTVVMPRSCRSAGSIAVCRCVFFLSCKMKHPCCTDQQGSWGDLRGMELVVRSLRSSSISWLWQDFRSQFLAGEKILAILWLMWVLKISVWRSCQAPGNSGPVVVVARATAWKSSFRSCVVAYGQLIGPLVPVLAVLVREMKISFLPSHWRGQNKSFTWCPCSKGISTSTWVSFVLTCTSVAWKQSSELATSP